MVLDLLKELDRAKVVWFNFNSYRTRWPCRRAK